MNAQDILDLTNSKNILILQVKARAIEKCSDYVTQLEREVQEHKNSKNPKNAVPAIVEMEEYGELQTRIRKASTTEELAWELASPFLFGDEGSEEHIHRAIWFTLNAITGETY